MLSKNRTKIRSILRAVAHAHGRVAARGNGNGQTVCQRLKAVG